MDLWDLELERNVRGQGDIYSGLHKIGKQNKITRVVALNLGSHSNVYRLAVHI